MEIHDSGFDQAYAPIHEMYSTGAEDSADSDDYSHGLGGSDDHDAAGNPHPGQIDVAIGGQHATASENVDLNRDGTPDSVAIRADNGDIVVFTDTDNDGDADHIEVFDPTGQHQLAEGVIDDNGNVTPDNGVQPATYLVDPATGEWTASPA